MIPFIKDYGFARNYQSICGAYSFSLSGASEFVQFSCLEAGNASFSP
jgi:hypothetical protein